MDRNSATAPLTKHDRQVAAGKKKGHHPHKSKPAPKPQPKGPLAGLNLDYSKPLGPKDIRSYIDSAVKLRYGGETQHLNQTRKQMPAWFENYRTALETGRAATQGAYDSAITQQRGAADASVARDTAAGADPNAAAAQRSQSDAFANLLATQSLSAQNRFRDLTAISQGEQVQSNKSLADAFTALRGEKDAFRMNTLGDLIDRERHYGLERSAFGLDQLKAQLGAQTDQAKIQQDAREHRQDRRDRRRERAQDRADKFHDADADGVPDSQDPAPSTPGDLRPGQGKDGGLSPSERRQRRKEAAKVMSTLDDAIAAVTGAGDDPGFEGLTGSQLRTGLANAVRGGTYNPRLGADGKPLVDPNTGAPIFTGSKFGDSQILSAALDYFLNPDHHISGKNRKRLRTRGARKRDLRPYRPKSGKQSYNDAVNTSPGGDRNQ